MLQCMKYVHKFPNIDHKHHPNVYKWSICRIPKLGLLISCGQRSCRSYPQTEIWQWNPRNCRHLTVAMDLRGQGPPKTQDKKPERYPKWWISNGKRTTHRLEQNPGIPRTTAATALEIAAGTRQSRTSFEAQKASSRTGRDHGHPG